MLPVTDRYIEMMTSGTRMWQYVRLRIPVIDPTAADDATVVPITSQMYYSQSAPIVYESEIEETYTTFEPGRWSVVYPGLVPSDSLSGPFTYTGLTVADLPNASGVFSANAGARVNFTTQHTFPALTLTFDTYYETHPTRIRLVGYRGSTVVQDATFTVDSVVFQAYPPNRSGFPQVDRVDILFLDMGQPYRRPRLEHVLFGYVYEPSNSEIVSVEMDWESDPLSRWLPVEKLKFTLSNFDYIYNPDNPEGIWNEFEERIPISVSFGQTLSGEFTWEDMYDYDWKWANRQTWKQIYEGKSIWWLNLGDFYLDGAPKTRGRTAEFTAVGAASILDDKYYKGSFGATTLYDLAVRVLEDSWLPKRDDGSPAYLLSDALKNFRTSAPMPIMTHAQALQLIANAGRCVIFSNKERQLCIEPMPDRNYPDTSVDFGLMEEPPDTDVTTVLGGVHYSSFEYNSTQDTRNVVDADYDVVAGEKLLIEFSSPVLSPTVTISDGSPYTVYAYAVEVTPRTTGTISVSITGRYVDVTGLRLSVPVEGARETSAWADFENQLVDSAKWARDNATWCRDYLLLRGTRGFDYAALPHLEVYDGIKIETLFTDALDVWILKHRLTFNGAIRGSMITKGKG